MIWNIVLTTSCNKNCTYCGGGDSTQEKLFPRTIAYDLDDLKRFLASDPHPVIAFYGGEPLLGIDMMERIMDEVPAERFVIQTNGTLLHELKDDYLFKLYTILLSIDGRKETTDINRGEGTHELVLRNARLVRTKGFAGEITARMCASEETSIYDDVTYLLGLQDDAGAPLFTGVHWQNDMMFGERESWDDLDGWLDNSYYPGIERLAADWVQAMKDTGEVRLIYPFVGLVRTILTGEPAKLHCGCGHFNNNICTNGKITACPVSSDFYEIFQIGTIYRNKPADFFDAMVPGEPCPSCEIYSVCGGRCLYANKTKPWGEDGYRKVCETVFHIVGVLRSWLPEIQALIDAGTVQMPQFGYFQYNGAEIVP
jgi:putative peptide-modifying radical SAM enzyme